MIWQSWNDFFKMGGYALYVWGSMIVVFIFMAAEVISLRVRSNAIRAELSNVRRSSRTSVNASVNKENQA
jgi:heme exporter protein D